MGLLDQLLNFFLSDDQFDPFCSKMITNPEYLAKDRLKAELKKRGISFSPNENKDYYVQLYRDEVMHGKETERTRSEFSSDEEYVRQSPRPARKQQKVRGSSPPLASGGHYFESLYD